MADVFLSYSRRDRAFAMRLQAALVGHGKDVWVDEEDIPPSARWRDELRDAIAAAGAFAFLISPDSAVSPECARELEHAEALGKRVIPVMVCPIDPGALPESLSARQFVPQRGCFDDAFDSALRTLVSAIDTDLEWVKAHTLWGQKALEWAAHRRDPSFLLSGAELDEAEQWLAGQAGKEPAPTELQAIYLLRSRQRATRRLRITRSAVSVALAVAIALSVVALVERATAVTNQQTAQSRQLAASAESVLGSDPELSTLLALRALQLHYTSQSEAALRDALPQLQILATLHPSAPLYSPSFSPDGKTVLTASADGAAELWDAANGRRDEVLGSASGVGLEQALFSPSGREVLTASDQGTARIWQVGPGRQMAVVSEPGGNVINGAAFRPDGKVFVTGSTDGTARQWNATTGGEVGPTITTPESVFAVAFDPSGGTIATAGNRGVTRLWSARTGTLLRTLRDPDQAALYSVQFSPDGTRLLTASSDGVARIWSPATGSLLSALVEPGRGAIYNATFSSDSWRALTVSYDGAARLWDARSGVPLGAIREPSGYSLEGASFSPDGSRIVTASLDGFARVWASRTGRQLTAMSEPTSSPLTTAAFSPNGSLILTAGDDGTAQLWRAATRALDGALVEPAASPIYSAAFSPDSTLVVTATRDGVARIWSVATHHQVNQLSEPGDGAMDQVGFSPTGHSLVAVSDDGTARVWSPAPGGATWTIPDPSVHSAGFSPNGTLIATTDLAQAIGVWDVATHRQLETINKAALGTLKTAVFTPNGKSLLVADTAGVARTFSLATRQPTETVAEPGAGAIASAVFSPDRASILTASADGSARLWDAATAKQVVAFLGHSHGVADAQPSPSGQFVVTAGDDGTAKVWYAASREQESELGAGILRAAFGDHGRSIITAGAAVPTQVWDAQTGTLLRSLPGPGGYLAALSPDGGMALTVGTDHAAHVWRLATATQSGVLRLAGDIIASAAFSPDGTRIATASATGVQIWNTQTLRLISKLPTPGSFDVSFDGSGQRLVVADDDGTARVFGTSTKSAIDVVSEPGGAGVTSAAFSSDGRLILTTSADGTARLWDVGSGALIDTFSEPGGAAIEDAAFGPGGLIGTGSLDGTARIWSAASGRQLTQFACGAAVTSVSFTPSGQLLTASGRARLWSIELAGSLASIERLARERVTRGFTPNERQRYLAGIGP